MISPQSQQAIDTLLAGDALGSGDNTVGPLDTKSQALLTVIACDLATLQRLTGESQAKELRKLHLEELERQQQATPPAAPQSPANAVIAASSSWRLQKVTCQSIRGLAPYGQRFEFDFAGKSNLIYGPNGSGKSSLMAAVSWVIRGIAITDADDPDETAPIRTTPQKGKTSKKISDWPVMAALPASADAAIETPTHWSQVELHEATTSRVLHLRRDGKGQLQSSTDGTTWNPADNLADLGISPLDIQLSIVAPTEFGRRTLEACGDTRSILSLMLGYDDLEQIGDFVTKASGNCTRLYNSEHETISGSRQDIRQQLEALPAKVGDKHALHADLTAMSSMPDPDSEQIKTVGTKVKKAVEDAQRSLAELMGIELGDQAPPANLADKLITAVSTLEKGVRSCFPSLGEQRIEAVFPPTETLSADAQLAEVESHLTSFVETARAKIAERYAWWQKETAPGSKTRLLLLAAQHYDVAKEECPVCESSLKERVIKSELEYLKDLDPSLVESVKTWFADLTKELKGIATASLVAVGDEMPAVRLNRDWLHLKDNAIGIELSTHAKKYDDQVSAVVAVLPAVQVSPPVILPEDADPGFVTLAADLTEQVQKIYHAIAILRWSEKHLVGVEKRLASVITDTQGEPPSLLATLSKGKQAAADVQPLKTVHAELRDVFKRRQAVEAADTALAALEQVRGALDNLKNVRKYAQSEVAVVFARIGNMTADNWNLLYGEMATGLKPGGLGLGAGRDKTVEALLSRGSEFDVPSQHFANAGLRRAIALAFYFSLLEEHPHGLGFAIMDDPILSLDEDHRETWSRELLRPRMDRLQFIVATHQRQYLNNCRNDFTAGQTFELIPRQRPGRVAWRPGNRLDRAEEELGRAPTNANNEMRKYREELFAALELYHPKPIALNIDTYATLRAPNPLAGTQRDKIVNALRSPEISKVLDPGSHAMTEADVTDAMTRTCLSRLRELNRTVVLEFERLDDIVRRCRQSLGVIAPSRGLAGLPTKASHACLQTATVIGRAAAQSDSCVIDEATSGKSLCLTVDTAALVSDDSIEPVAKRGQWVLLAHVGVVPHDGDLVAVEDGNGNRYLRRAWSDGSRWILHAVNPVLNIRAVAVSKDSPIQKVIGVLFDPARQPSGNKGGISEWQPRSDFNFDWLHSASLVTVEGDSLNPIARRGQYAMVGPKTLAQKTKIAPGTLAAIDTTESHAGQVIKCIFVRDGDWILTSRNPVEVIPPLVIPSNEVRSVWPVCGVLFEHAVAEAD